MWRVIIHMVLMTGGALVLAGCGIADSRSPVPEFMRAKASEPPPPEAPPDVKQLVREKLDSVFVAARTRTRCRFRRRATSCVASAGRHASRPS